MKLGNLAEFGGFDEYMRTWDEDHGRPNFMDKIWQMSQSNDTKTLNSTGLRRTFGLGTTVRVVGADKAQGILN